jgi:hypothetical protein
MNNYLSVAFRIPFRTKYLYSLSWVISRSLLEAIFPSLIYLTQHARHDAPNLPNFTLHRRHSLVQSDGSGGSPERSTGGGDAAVVGFGSASPVAGAKVSTEEDALVAVLGPS